jgi:hypothetical protein
VTIHGVAMLALLACALLATQAGAVQRLEGRWAAQVEACSATGASVPLLVVEALSLRWRDATCEVRASYRVRDTWHIAARCLADGVARYLPIKLEFHGSRLVLNWPATPAQLLQPCPPASLRQGGSQNSSDEQAR